MKWLRRSRRRPAEKYVSLYPVICREAEAPALTTEYFASRLGSEAGKLILDNQYGFMVGYKNREIVRVPLEDVAGKLKTVDPDATIVQEAKMLGICFGD